MPLQKLPPNGPLSVSASVNQRPQLQNRRRTLQTISELSTNEGSLPDFVSSIGIESIRRMGHNNVPGVARSTPKPVKRQSLPQHRSVSQSRLPQSPITVVPIQDGQSSNRGPAQGRRPMASTTDQVEGWNAKRERARMRHELAIAELRSRQSTSDLGTSLAVSMSADRLSVTSHRSSIRHTSSQRSLMENDIPCSCSSGQVERHANLGGTTVNTSQYDAPPIASERASTDSSSYQSRDSAINRSKSSSSNTSYTSQEAPPLLYGTTSSMSGYCARLNLQNRNLVAFGESARSKNLNPQRSSRTLSLPTNESKHYSAPHRYMTAPDLRRTLTQQPRAISAQRARNQALAALTAVNSHMQPNKTSEDIVCSPHQDRHASLTSHPPNVSAQRTSMQYRLTSPLPLQFTSTSVKSLPHPSQRRHSDAPRKVSFETRTVPKRESLTQWKKEREEARAGLHLDQKARIQERVRRANEQELEREKELVLMGKRRAKDDVGCFGGLLVAFRRKGQSG